MPEHCPEGDAEVGALAQGGGCMWKDKGAEYGRIGAVCGRVGGLSADGVTAREKAGNLGQGLARPPSKGYFFTPALFWNAIIEVNVHSFSLSEGIKRFCWSG